MAQVLDKQIQHFLPLLGNEEKKSLLSVIKSFLNLRKEIPGQMSIEQYNKELDFAEAEFENGDYISHEEMIKQVKQW